MYTSLEKIRDVEPETREINECARGKKYAGTHSGGKTVSRRMCMRKKVARGWGDERGGHVSAFTLQLIWGCYQLFLFILDATRRRYLGCREILQDHARVGTPLVKLKNIPGRANRSMR